MKRLFHTAIFGCLVLSAAHQAPSEAKIPVWRVSLSDRAAGDNVQYFSPQGIAFVFPTYRLLTKPPEWDFIMYNKTSYYEASFAASEKEIKRQTDMSAQVMGLVRQQNWKSEGLVTESGLRVHRFLCTLNKGEIKRVECSLAEDLRVPREMSKWGSKIYGAPDLNRPILNFVFVNKDGSKNRMIGFKSAEKTSVPDNFFQLPSGLKKVRSQMEVIIGDEGQQTIEDMVKGLGVPEKAKGQKSR